MIHLYGVVDDPHPRPTGLTVIPLGRLACVAAESAVPDPPRDGDSLLAHDAVIADLMRTCTVVPFRFGTVFADASEAYRALAPRSGVFEALLARLAGKVELGVRAAMSTPSGSGSSVVPHLAGVAAGASPPDDAGRSYLAALAAACDSGSLERLHRALAGAAEASVCSTGPGSSIRSAYLVDRDGVDAFGGLLRRTVDRLPDVEQVSLTGPWAPYSFVTECDPERCGV
jgi:hypothetical protein